MLGPLAAAVQQFSEVGDAVENMASRTGLSAQAVVATYLGQTAVAPVRMAGSTVAAIANVARSFGSMARTAAVGIWDRFLAASQVAFTYAAAGVRGVATTLAALASVLGTAVGGIAGQFLFAMPLVISAIGAVGGALLALVSPIGLIMAAVAGAIYAWTRFSSVGGQVATAVGSALQELFTVARMVFGGIANALAAGDLKLAARILWQGLKVLWYTGVNQLNQAWPVLAAGAQEVWQWITQTAGTVVAWVADLWGKLPGFITGPLGLLAKAVAGVLSWIGQRFGGLKDWAVETFGAIAKALSQGEFAIAGEIAWTSIKLAFVSGMSWVTTAWTEFATGLAVIWDGVVTTIRQVWNNVISWIAKQLLNAVGMIQDALAALEDWDPTGLAAMLKESLNVDVEGAIRVLEEDQARTNRELEAAKEERNAERARAMQARQAETERQLAALRAARDEALARAAALGEPKAGPAEGKAGLDTAIGELEKLLAEAAKAPKLFDPDSMKLDAFAGMDQKMLESAGKFASQGTFNAAAAFGMAAGGVNERAMKAAELTAQNTRQLVDHARRGRLVFG